MERDAEVKVSSGQEVRKGPAEEVTWEQCLKEARPSSLKNRRKNISLRGISLVQDLERCDQD